MRGSWLRRLPSALCFAARPSGRRKAGCRCLLASTARCGESCNKRDPTLRKMCKTIIEGARNVTRRMQPRAKAAYFDMLDASLELWLAGNSKESTPPWTGGGALLRLVAQDVARYWERLDRKGSRYQAHGSYRPECGDRERRLRSCRKFLRSSVSTRFLSPRGGTVRPGAETLAESWTSLPQAPATLRGVCQLLTRATRRPTPATESI